ncbi:oligosaccharide flippase family protein [Pedobacter sp. FW305-3-2-15-E-R2A2]|uniref:lipopolysaccharide biosynthesis protein n=1 Tax=Pedobacter sp. FW305-3-2-15-E-R2A2 TaxID=3140251 RepID=UPI0031405239
MHFQSLLGNAVMAGFGMITLAILYRGLSATDIGTYIFFLTAIGLIDTLRVGFLTTTFVKFYTGTEKERGEAVAGASWVIALLITVFLFLLNIPAYFIASHVSNEGLVLFLKYFSIISVMTLPTFMANCVVQADKRFDRLLWLRVMTQGSFTLIVFILALMGKLSIDTVVGGYCLSYFVSGILVFILKWTMIRSIKNAEKPTVLELFHFGKYSMGTNIGANLFGVTNTFVINFLIGPAALAMYNLGGKLTQLIEIPLSSFGATGMPILSSYYNRGEKEEMMYTLKKFIGMITIALVPVVIMAVVFAEPIIRLIAGKGYIDNETPNLFRMFMIIALLYPADRFFALALDVIHQPKVNFYKILVMLAVNISTVFLGISLYHSVYTIAIASIFPTLIAILMTYYPLYKYSKFSFWSMFIIGYKEIIVFLKQMSKALLSKG